MVFYENDMLEEHILELIRKIGKVDIVIGIPSLNNEATIGKIIRSFGQGLKEYYPGLNCLIINSDGGSTDSTRKIVQSIKPWEGTSIVSTIYRGKPGKGSAFRTIFEIARMLDAKVVVVSDSDTSSITNKWCYNLIEPVLKLGYGYVTPYYVRDKHDATITNAIVYPVTRALYGLRLRQPIGGDFSFSNGALQVFLQKKHWDTFPYISRFGIDIWMTTIAVNEGFRVCQSVLGTKEHEKKDPGLHLLNMFKEVIGTMFELAGYYAYRWRTIIKSNQGFIFGDFKFTEVERIDVNIQNMLEKFHSGQQQFDNLWKIILHQETYNEFMSFINKPKNNIVIPVQVWAKIIYDYVCAYNFAKNEQRELILNSLAPLYYIRTVSFIKEAEYFDEEIADAVVEGNASVFERLKGYLVKRWEQYEKGSQEILN